jgi:hypothetical protein
MTSIVYVYAHRCARPPMRDELKWSLRSLANIQGSFEPIVFGDPPDWYIGPKVVMPPQAEHYRDIAAKFKAIAESPCVTDRFIVWMDDTLAWSPIDLDDISIPRSTNGKTKCHSKVSWHKYVRPTLMQCNQRGLGVIDASTHWPYPFEKTKLLETMKLFEADKRNVCLETAYVNHHHQETKPLGDDFMRTRSEGNIPDSVKIFNYVAINAPLRTILAARFPRPSPWEREVHFGV